MKLNYFDFGVCYGREVSLMEKIIIPDLKIKNYKIFGFEACRDCYNNLIKKYQEHPNVSLINAAISNHNGKGLLYHSYKENNKYTPIGNSLFESKWNVKKEDYEEVDCILFSDWIKKNIPDYKNNFNIIRMNIEGAEWHLFNDLKNNKLFKHINIFCGPIPQEEMMKVEKLKKHIPKLNKILKKNKIKIHTFIDWPDVDNFKQLIKNKFLRETYNEK
jgi:FkbM family methyltransferase